MKKFLGLALLALALNGCDDGNAKVEAITFDDSNASICGNLIYKTTANQALIITVESSSFDAFANNPEGIAKPYAIGNGFNVRFRTYSGTVDASVICTSPAPISPIAVTEWVATSGSMEVTTTTVYGTPDATTGQTKIVNYRHAIVFKDLHFSKPDGTDQVYSEYVFGNYLTSPDRSLPLDFDPEQIALCPDTNTLYNAKNAGNEGLFIKDFDAGLLSTDNLGTPKTAVISETANRVVYRFFNGALPTGGNEGYFCSASTTTATAPGTAEEWIAQNGVAGGSGIVEVTTTTNGSGFQHTIRLKGVTFQRGNSTFYYGNDILVGTLLQ